MIPFLLALLFSGPAAAGAFPAPEAMGGFEGTLRSGYAFASVMSPSVDKRVTPVARLTLNYLYYRFPDQGGEARVISPGLAFGVGASWRPDRLSLTLVAGYEARYVQTRPTTGAPVARADHGVSVSGDVYFQASSRVALASSVSYGFAQNYLWARALAKRQLFPVRGTAVTAFAMGLDGTVQGNEQARSVGGGLFGELSFPGARTALGLRVGLSREIQPGASNALLPSLGGSIYKSF
ncbi:MAG: cellulose biosynthesis protein BcsS [Pseudomonadota bacterium]|nr:cellulose biosynthesis protein BcsS [Pseudomonadota bacterium]